ncbi:sterigmatocystin biosynthesis fatty acid synthase subunit beta [Aspergillus sclerotioniger CBS 115572]|uniref:Sterigmatocystin biosynthesis fatty acid synthase subunit beta n=1 Tax=Aspergillus sclerotioniger CBS 115572 TaxID=1450535 RepID=A0A317VUH0_9EURO|nr:sterigmatocystin biosynthesis fatty acid synthase subunit beta [Aspergillus sclerotioniger CBS 115572]PWY78034.1 sterigmatocystin biosynthesis fatty acid synthase subunit beta [Aspergillus sclerotioniger CBS 115572]
MVDISFHVGNSRLDLSIPIIHAQSLQPQKAAFISSLPSSSNRGAIQSPPALCLAFIEFLVNQECVSKPALAAVLRAFDVGFLHRDKEIHCLVAQLTTVPSEQQQWLEIYYRAVEASGDVIPGSSIGYPCSRTSALFDHVQTSGFHLMAVFGGQGEASRTCVQELADLYTTYRPMFRLFLGQAAELLCRLSKMPNSWFHNRGRSLDLMTWISDKSTMPDCKDIAQSPISVPVIGVLSLARYLITCRILDINPGELRALLSSTTGHSQGLMVSTVIAMSDSWDSFYANSYLAIEALFWLGWECHRSAPGSSSLVSSASDCGGLHAEPAYMLTVRGVTREQLDSILARLNGTLSADEQVQMALVNSRDQFVVAGPVTSLVHMHSYLSTITTPDTDHSRIPFSNRQPVIHYGFLPISTPFHTRYLEEAVGILKRRFSDRQIVAEQLRIPVYHTLTGQDLRQVGGNILHAVLDAIAREICDWPAALSGQHPHDTSKSLSHIIVFDRGGLGPMVKKIQEGKGIRIIQGSDLNSRDPEMGTMQDLFSPRLLDSSTRLQSWAQQFQPRLTTGPAGLETRITSLLGTPPVMVAGMTPTTVHWDFVSAIMNAGYHAELAGGGYRNSSDMAMAIDSLVANIARGRGITCNLIYANPRAMCWQIALLRRLSHSRVPIDGLTIGAGVPSLEIASEYIRTLGLRHISFKPGSVATIRQVIDIAKAHPDFPIILQWTGGRGGGHHSFEDFYAPMLSTYGLIRQQPNIYLVVGSGFGNSDSIYPYITGQWSLSLGYPCMPFDGVLLGSRLMVAQEAHTSSAVKDIIANTPGVPDAEWEKTYNGPAGGVITVQSEMGEPIHKIATRGVRLWADMDRTVFSLPRKDRIAYLAKHHHSIIHRLNSDFAKPWFGRNDLGDVVGLEEMTYTEVLARLVDLMYVQHQKRWIDPTYVDFTMAVASRALERLPRAAAGQEANISRSVLSEAPALFLSAFAVACPTAADEILNPEDVSYFLTRSQMPGQKPVNFIPVLNEDFEFYFKKDSLWQAEDTDAVVDQDADRVCILHGPVAAQYSLGCDQSAREILDTITHGLAERMQQDVRSEDSTPGSGSGLITPDSWSSVSGVKEIAIEDFSLASTTVSESTDDRTVSVTAAVLGTSPSWPAWVRAVFGDKMIFRGRSREKNPFQQFVTLYPDTIMRYDFDRSEVCVTVQDPCKATSLMKISCLDGVDIRVDLYPPQVSDPLQLVYRFDSSSGPFGLSELTKKRNARVRSFYNKIWLQENTGPCSSIQDTFYGRKMKLTRELLDDLAAAVGPAFPDARLVLPISDVLPVSTGIIVAWDVITRPLVAGDLDGDLLRLVHRSNAFEYSLGASALRVGDSVRCQSQVQAVYVEDAGKVIVVEAQIIRSGKAVMSVTSSFLYRGVFKGGSTFRRTKSEWTLSLESDLDETVLRHRSWFHIHDNAISLVGKCLVFCVETYAEDKELGFKSLRVTGTVCFQDRGCRGREVGTVNFECEWCAGNPVLQFLERKASPLRNQTSLRNPGWPGPSSIEVQMPVSNQPYAEISTDYNPIHVSTIFASLADLPGTVCHGMCTSAIAVAALEYLALKGDRSRLRYFTANFTGMVMPLEKLVVLMKHIGMVDGRMRFTVDVVRKEDHEKVLVAEAIVDQPATAYLFTGQGSQSRGMGMDLYRSSPVAKSMWDGIDEQLYASYGWSVLDIVRNNPKSVTVHFGGKRGRQIRENYLAITTETVLSDGVRVQVPVLSGLTPRSTSYTFTDSRGLLYSTQFAQPAILLFEAAAVADLRDKGYVPPDAMYAGHSLGEFGALSALSSSIPMGALAELAFYRGLMMQASVSRSDQGVAYGMVAVNPKRVGRSLDETRLGGFVRAISLASQELLEVVNYNVEGEQYVCSGTITNLWVLGRLMDQLAQLDRREVCKATAPQDEVIIQLLSEAKNLPQPIQLRRGQATIPLEGIDVPFHSSHLRSTVARFRQCLLRPGFLEGNVDLEALRRYIPNVMARPFSVDEAYIQEAYERTQSPILGEILGVHEV